MDDAIPRPTDLEEIMRYVTPEHNVAFGIPKDQIDMKAIIKATKLAQIHDFIENDCKNGYDTVIGERDVIWWATSTNRYSKGLV